MDLWKQMMAGIDQGESGDILLAKPLREKIVEEYKNDESPKIKNPQYFEEQTFLCIDMSVPTIQRIIEHMENFKSIKSLMITCSKGPVAVDLDDLLSRAKNYPLEQLHIINFKHFVADVPETIDQFPNLKMLSLFNNNINQLPVSVAQLVSLQTFYVDMNPVSTLMPMISSLSKLEALGIAKTNISESEIEQIKTLLPNCKILAQ
jgi:Leucine-rich repeat (LRR) protein